ncbi:hypothetical protein EG327_004995 [Venturia inaequalis]|uniref:Uncharacterized protein n=1 Tax=Venturia inaequalis TaxID=5025 RepID=A0A8H3V7C6_VENIN|nr:hypothetical protein EG327_004995 [Venturia inaequalis]
MKNLHTPPAMKPSTNRYALLDDKPDEDPGAGTMVVYKPKEKETVGYGVGIFRGKKGKEQTIPWLFFQERDLRKYEDFPVLYRERKFCRDAPLKPIVVSGHVELLNLPGDIRNHIYSKLSPGKIVMYLVPDQASRQRRPHRKPDGVKKYSELVPGLKLARVNKQLNVEVSSYFYSRNQFIFPDTVGIVTLLSFLNTIGGNCRYLQSVSVSMPLRLRTTKELFDSLARRGLSVPTFAPWKDTDLLLQLVYKQLKKSWLKVLEVELSTEDSIYQSHWSGKNDEDRVHWQLLRIAKSKATFRVLFTTGGKTCEYLGEE